MGVLGVALEAFPSLSPSLSPSLALALSISISIFSIAISISVSLFLSLSVSLSLALSASLLQYFCQNSRRFLTRETARQQEGAESSGPSGAELPNKPPFRHRCLIRSHMCVFLHKFGLGIIFGKGCLKIWATATSSPKTKTLQKVPQATSRIPRMEGDAMHVV